MLKSGEVELVIARTLKPGDVVILKNRDSATIAMRTNEPKGIWLREIAVAGAEDEVDGDERLLKLTVPVTVRFDPFSASPADEQWPPTGTLVFAHTGAAVFTRATPSRGRGAALRLDGVFAPQHISEEVMTFGRWTLGIERTDGFYPLSEIDVTEVGDED